MSATYQGTLLHDWAIDEREYRRHEERRGRRHAYERLDPARTALVVVDLVPFFVEGSAYCRGIVPHVNLLAGELRAASSAFFPGRCELHGLLADRGVDTVVVTGTVSNVCVESTVRDASTLDYRVVLVADGCAAASDRDHNATLHVVHRSYGDVRPTCEVVDLIRR